MLVNILSTEIKERAIILTVKTVGFLARMDKLTRFEPMHLSEAKNSLSAASFGNRVLLTGGYNLNGLSKTVDMLTLNDSPTPTEYATVTYHFPSALVQYNFGE